jgi:hypothetical protein
MGEKAVMAYVMGDGSKMAGKYVFASHSPPSLFVFVTDNTNARSTRATIDN